MQKFSLLLIECGDLPQSSLQPSYTSQSLDDNSSNETSSSSDKTLEKKNMPQTTRRADLNWHFEPCDSDYLQCKLLVGAAGILLRPHCLVKSLVLELAPDSVRIW
jgi:hypothetical protein